MVITIDTSALLAVLVNESHKARIVEISKDCDLQAPVSLDAEIGNALSAMFKRNKISINAAKTIIEQFRNIPLRRTAIRLQDSIRIAAQFNIYAYDAYVLDCAQQFRTPLLSLDKRMIDVAQKLEINTLDI